MTQKRSIETKKKIMDAAKDLFSKSGYESASVSDICNTAGISKGAFYHHFPSKQSVFLQLLSEWLDGIDAGLTNLRGDQPDTARAFLQMTEILPTVLQAAEGRLPIFLEFWLHTIRDENLWKDATRPFSKYREAFADMIRKGMADGSFSTREPQTAASAVMALAIGLLVQGIVDPNGQDWPRVNRESMDILMKGLTGKTS